MHLLKHNKTEHKTHFISGANSYMLRHQSAIISQFINNRSSYIQHVFRTMVTLPSAVRDTVLSYVDTEICVHSPGCTNRCECVTKEDHRCDVLLLRQCNNVLADMLTLQLQWRWPAPEIRVGPTNFAVDKIPDNGALLPKHVGVGMWYEVCFMICFIVFLIIHDYALKISYECLRNNQQMH
jgi:hypothetical protein